MARNPEGEPLLTEDREKVEKVITELTRYREKVERAIAELTSLERSAAYDHVLDAYKHSIRVLRRYFPEEPGETSSPVSHRCENRENPQRRGLIFPSRPYGAAITECTEDARGRLWCSNDEYMTRVNFCPFCGYKAPRQVEIPS